MNQFEKRINQELDSLKLSDDFTDQILKKSRSAKKNDNRIIKAACLVGALCLVGGGSVTAYSYLNHKIYVNQKEALELDPMLPVMVSWGDAAYNEKTGEYEKQYADYKTLQEELGIDLLGSSMAEENPYASVYYSSDQENWVSIDVNTYIVGDLTNLQKVETGNRIFYNGTKGMHFQTPVNLKILLLTNEQAVKEYQGKDYLGNYSFEKQIITDSGIRVDLLGDEETDGLSCYTAVFVADGIQYELSGHVDEETMIEILNSMQ